MQSIEELHYTKTEKISTVSTTAVKIREEELLVPKNSKACISYKLHSGEQKLKIQLEEGAEADLICTHSAKAEEKVHADITTTHLGKQSKSSMLVKGVVKDKAEIFIEGEIIINKEAQDSEGYQQLDILMIGKEAKGQATPKLGINNPLVICSHGASVGSIDAEQLFYLQSRGLNEEEAEEIITKGFLTDTATYIHNIELYEALKEKRT